jgi:hypothetical protein
VRWAEQAWDHLHLGKAPVSDMIKVCEQIEAIQQRAAVFLGL